MVSDRCSLHNHLPVEHAQFCWSPLERDLVTMAERQGASGEVGAELLALRQELFEHWHQDEATAIDGATMRFCSQPLRLGFEQTMQRAVDLVHGDKRPGRKRFSPSSGFRTQKQALWFFLDHPGLVPTNNAALDKDCSAGVRAMRPAVILRKVSLGVQSARGPLPQPPAHPHHHPAATRSGCLGLK